MVAPLPGSVSAKPTDPTSSSAFFEQLTATAPDASVTAARMKNFEAALRIIVRFLLGGTFIELGLRTGTDQFNTPVLPTRFEPTGVTNTYGQNQWAIRWFANRAAAHLSAALPNLPSTTS